MFRLLRLEDRIVLDGAAPDVIDQIYDHDNMEAYAPIYQEDDADILLPADEAGGSYKVLVVSSNIVDDDGDALADAAKEGVCVVNYDPASTTLKDLTALIESALSGKKADSIAFASHGNEGSVELVNGQIMTGDSLAQNADHAAFWQEIGKMLNDTGRIDLLACSAGNDGSDLIDGIKQISGATVAASTDLTGNPALGADWILETEGVDAAAVYFDADRLDDVDLTLQPASTLPATMPPAGQQYLETVTISLKDYITSDKGGTLTFDSLAADGFDSDFMPIDGNWLSLNKDTGVLSGTTDNAHAGNYYVSFDVTDSADSVSKTFSIDTLTVTAVNDAPVVTAPANAAADIATAKNITGITVNDEEAAAGNTEVKVTMTVTNGTIDLAQITGLTFATGDGTDDATMTFTGSIANVNAALAAVTYEGKASWQGQDTLNITANDQDAGGAKEAQKAVTVSVGSLDPISKGLPAEVLWTQGLQGNFKVDAYFTDPDGNNDLTYNIVSSGGFSPGGTPLDASWLTLGFRDLPDDAKDGFYVYSTTNPTEVGNYFIEFDVTNPVGHTITETLTIKVQSGADTKIVTVTAPPVKLTDTNLPYNFVPHFNDPQGHALSYVSFEAPGFSGTGTPIDGASWLTLNTTTGVLSGTPTAANAGNYSIYFIVRDTLEAGDEVAVQFDLTAAAANTKIVTVTATPATLTDANIPYNFVPHFNDPQGHALTYVSFEAPGFSTTGTPLDGTTWLSLNTNTGELTGTPTAANAGNYSIYFIVRDPLEAGDEVPVQFDLTVAAPNTKIVTITPPPAVMDIANLPHTFGTDFTDPQSHVLTYINLEAPGFSTTGTPLDGATWLKLDTNTGALTGTPGPGALGNYSVYFIVRDPLETGDEVPVQFDLTVTTVDTAIDTITVPPADFTIPYGISLNVYDNLGKHFSDPENHALTFEIVEVGGFKDNGDPVLITGAPAWLSVDPATGALKSNATADFAGNYSVHCIVRDPSEWFLPSDEVNIQFDLKVQDGTKIITITEPPTDLTTPEDSTQSWNFGQYFIDPQGHAVNFTIVDAFGFAPDSTPISDVSWLTIDPATGVLSATNPDDPHIGTFSVYCVVNDPLEAGDEVQFEFDITVTSVNDPPVIVSPGAQTVDMNTALAINGIKVSDIDAQAADTLQVTLTVNNGNIDLARITGLTFTTGDGMDDAKMVFTGTLADINAALAAVTYMGNISFTGADVLNIRVDDLGHNGAGGAKTGTGNVPINVGIVAVNNPPAFEAEPYIFTIEENSPTDTIVDRVIASDPDGNALTFTITGGNKNDAFTIDKTTGEIFVKTTAALDFEAMQEFRLTVTVTDNGDPVQIDTTTVTIRLIDVPEIINRAPVFMNEPYVFAIDENSAAGIEIGQLTATDPDADTLTYSITGGNTGDAFAIDSKTGKITVKTAAVLDYETTKEFDLTVRVTDSGNPVMADTTTVKITLNDLPEINNPPQFTNEPYAFEIDENSAFGVNVGQLTAVDPDGDTLTYLITEGNIGDAFIIDAATGVITVNTSSALDYETIQTFNLTVQSADNRDPAMTDITTVTINLKNVVEAVNNPPQFINEPYVMTISENSPGGTVAGIVAAADPDIDVLTYSIISGNTDNAFSIDAQTGEIFVNNPSALNYELIQSITLTVQVQDNGDGLLRDTTTVTINLTNVPENDAPVFSAETYTFEIPENSNFGVNVGTIKANDQNDDMLTYAIIAGNTNDAFVIDPLTGVITVNNTSVLDYETTPVFTLTVQAVDYGEGNLTDTASVTIRLTDSVEAENRAPVIQEGLSFTLPENTIAGTMVGRVTATDPDGDTVTFTIVSGNTGSAFSINPVTGEIRVNNASMLDYETSPMFILSVQATDNGAPVMSDTNTIRILLTDVQEVVGVNHPPVLQEGAIFGIEENSAAGTNVGRITASDPDGDTLTFSITEGNTNGAFAIDANTGTITVKNQNAIDYETTPVFTLKVQVQDNGAGLLTDTETVVIHLTDVVEKGVKAVSDNVSTDEDTAVKIKALDNDVVVSGALSVKSVDTAQTQGKVTINADNTISYDPAPAYQHLSVGETATDTFTYTITDNSGNTDAATVTVTIKGVNDAPVISGIPASQVFSDTESIRPFANFKITDVDDPGESHTITIKADDTDNGEFTNLAASGFIEISDGAYRTFGTTEEVQSSMRMLIFQPDSSDLPLVTTDTRFAITVENNGDEVEAATAVKATSSVLPTEERKEVELWSSMEPTPFWKEFSDTGKLYDSEILGLYVEHNISIFRMDPFTINDLDVEGHGISLFRLKQFKSWESDIGAPDLTEDLFELANRMLDEAEEEAEKAAENQQ